MALALDPRRAARPGTAKRFIGLSRMTHSVLDVAHPASGALLVLGAAPSAPIAMDPGTAAGTNGSDAAGSAVPGTAGTPGVPAPGTGAAGAAPTQTTPVPAVASPPVPAAGTSTPRSPASASSSTRATAPATSAASAGASAPAGGSAPTDAAPATAPTTPTPVPAAVAPSPVASAAPAPAPAAEDAIPAGKARVHLQGDAKSVWLQSAGGNFRPGLVPVGTYRIQVFFEGMAAQSVGEVTVGEGEERTIVCHKALSNCKVQ